jgi:hypothetical protein
MFARWSGVALRRKPSCNVDPAAERYLRRISLASCGAEDDVHELGAHLADYHLNRAAPPRMPAEIP